VVLCGINWCHNRALDVVPVLSLLGMVKRDNRPERRCQPASWRVIAHTGVVDTEPSDADRPLSA
jgi:hypothetical protein